MAAEGEERSLPQGLGVAAVAAEVQVEAEAGVLPPSGAASLSPQATV